MEVTDFHEEIFLAAKFDPVGHVFRLFGLCCLAILLMVLCFIVCYYIFVIGRLNYLDYKSRNSTDEVDQSLKPNEKPDGQPQTEELTLDSATSNSLDPNRDHSPPAELTDQPIGPVLISQAEPSTHQGPGSNLRQADPAAATSFEDQFFFRIPPSN